MIRRRNPHPLDRLAMAMRVAALNIADPNFRKMAVREAERIPVCNAEIGGGRRGEMARLGRSILAGLADAPDDQLQEKAGVLRGCAYAVASRFELISETRLGERRRSYR